MSYGLRIRDSSGNIIFNTDTVTFRIRYSTVASSGSSSSIVLSDISGKTTYAVSIPLNTGLAHSVAISGTTFSWTAISTSRFASADSLVLVLLKD